VLCTKRGTNVYRYKRYAQNVVQMCTGTSAMHKMWYKCVLVQALCIKRGTKCVPVQALCTKRGTNVYRYKRYAQNVVQMCTGTSAMHKT